MVDNKVSSVMVDLVTLTGDKITVNWRSIKLVGVHEGFWYIKTKDDKFIFLDKKSSVKVLELIQKDGIK